MNIYLFNFSSSYIGGGLKRLLAFSKWFDENGGAYFIINDKAEQHVGGYSNNYYHCASPGKFNKATNKYYYLTRALKDFDVKVDFYYSYGIPIPFKVGRVNWFHLSNVLPLIDHSGYGLPILRSVELKWLGYLIKKNYKNTEILSAESNYSLSLFPQGLGHNPVPSLNGSDEEIELFSNFTDRKINNVAVVVGTFFYKNLSGSYKIFQKLREEYPGLRMAVVGNISMIPLEISNNKSVDILGSMNHQDVINLLSSARFYINTSKVENSWNAASEGVLLANESYISKIGPHVELVEAIANKKCTVKSELIHVKRKDISVEKLMAWSDIIQDMDKLFKKLQ